MKRFLAALTVAALTAIAPAAADEPLHMTTEDYAPYTFMEDGEVVGIGGDQIRELMARAGLDYRVEMMPWARALSLAERRPRTCVFTAAHTEDRHPRFKWVEPLFVDRALVAGDEGTTLAPKTAAELAQYRIGTQTGDYTIEMLSDIGVTDIDTAKTHELSVIKLLKGRVDLVSLTEDAMATLGKQGVVLEPVYTLSEVDIAIACNKTVPDETVAKMQDALDSMREDGFQDAVIAKYR